MKTKLIVFTRYPEAGCTKTRLIPALGTEGAADLQRRMTEKVVRTVQHLSKQIPLESEVRFAGGSISGMKEWLGEDCNCHPQGRGDLGERLSRSFAESFSDDCRKVVVIGADCPSISTTILETAFKKLADHDLVLGPATDGGYYLVGLSILFPHLFENLPWGSNTMLLETIAIAERSDLSFFLLEELSDVDRPEDLTPGIIAEHKR